MSYPKPLSQKTLDKMYKESNLSEEKIVFLRKLFDSASALYGIIPLCDLWEVYKEYSQKAEAVKIHRKDILSFSSIARREVHDYYIYEIDELYIAEKKTDQERYIINHEILDFLSIHVFHQLDEMVSNKPYYVPENLLEYKGHVVTEEEKRLFQYIENLRADSPVLTKRYNKEISKPSPHQGKKLKDFSYLTDSEQFELDWVSGKCEGGPKTAQEKKIKEFWAFHSGNAAEKIFRRQRILLFCGLLSTSRLISSFIEDLQETGVILSEKQLNMLISLYMEFNNNSHLYSNRGWTPNELSRITMSDYKGPITMSLGPGIIKAAKEGKFSLDELKSKIKAMGFNVLEDNNQ